MITPLRRACTVLVAGGLAIASALCATPSSAAPAERFTTAPNGLMYAPPTSFRKVTVAASSTTPLKIEVNRSTSRPSGVKVDKSGLPTSPVRLHCTGLGVLTSNPSVDCELSQTGSKIASLPVCFDLQSANADFDQACFQVSSGRGVGIGDSYASGEGGGDYVRSRAANDLGRCDRSKNAASQQLFDKHLSKMRYDLLACTGFTSDDIRTVKVSGPKIVDSATQLDFLDRDVTLVTLSAGGNDAGFSDDVTSCLKVTRCDIDRAFTTKLEDRLAEIPGRLNTLYDAVRARAPHAHVLVQGYPFLFPRDGQCRRTDIRIYGAGTITPEEYHYLMDREAWLNTMIETAAREHGFTFVNVATPDSPDSFAGHWSCGPSSWIHDLTLRSGTSAKLSLNLQALHPTKEGQKRLANLLWAALSRIDWTPPTVWTPAEVFRTAPARNPSGAWNLLQGRGLDTGTYTPLDSHSPTNCGRTGLVSFTAPAGFPSVLGNNTGADLREVTGPGCGSTFSIPRGGVSVHPYDQDVILSWTSPIDGTVAITGHLSDADKNGGNGISWQLAMHNPADAQASPLQSGAHPTSGRIPNGGSWTINDQPIGQVRVYPGTRLLLIVGADGDPDFDLTNVEFAITQVR